MCDNAFSSNVRNCKQYVYRFIGIKKIKETGGNFRFEFSNEFRLVSFSEGGENLNGFIGIKLGKEDFDVVYICRLEMIGQILGTDFGKLVFFDFHLDLALFKLEILDFTPGKRFHFYRDFKIMQEIG